MFFLSVLFTPPLWPILTRAMRCYLNELEGCWNEGSAGSCGVVEHLLRGVRVLSPGFGVQARRSSGQLDRRGRCLMRRSSSADDGGPLRSLRAAASLG